MPNYVEALMRLQIDQIWKQISKVRNDRRLELILCRDGKQKAVY